MSDEIELLSEEDARATVLRYIASKEWWVIPCLNAKGSWASLEIEKRFYANGEGGSTSDFKVMLGPAMVSFARKSCLSAEALATWFAGVDDECTAAEWEKRLEKQDILIFSTEGTRDQTEAAAYAWHDWILAE